ncbi:hypothetical protein QAD02_003225 [Eretmocerus hayati]|uniref:Uncharacterized protein n=1 Tax=Eretmocerus hayati TaxID=131215 RepID=A0ACC2NMY1_9HYME|nr:hypothetical protein QAD02_003225 [Eretmocerus hayati]
MMDLEYMSPVRNSQVPVTHATRDINLGNSIAENCNKFIAAKLRKIITLSRNMESIDGDDAIHGIRKLYMDIPTAEAQRLEKQSNRDRIYTLASEVGGYNHLHSDSLCKNLTSLPATQLSTSAITRNTGEENHGIDENGLDFARRAENLLSDGNESSRNSQVQRRFDVQNSRVQSHFAVSEKYQVASARPTREKPP